MTQYMARFHKDTNPDCICFEDENLALVVQRNTECPVHGDDEQTDRLKGMSW